MSPQLPPLPPPEPLDDQERALARALRGLPASMPSPELDARILGASRRAIAAAPKPHTHRRGWVWGLSSAAAAVLATGVMLKMHTQGRDQAIAPASQAPAAAVALSAKVNASANATTATAASADMQVAQPMATTNAALKAAKEPASGAAAPADRAAAKSADAMREAAQQGREELHAAKPVATAPSTLGAIAPLDKSAARQGAASNAAAQPSPTSTLPPPPAQSLSPERSKREAALPLESAVVTDHASRMSAPTPPPAPPPSASAAKAQPHPTPAAPSPEAIPMQESGSTADARKDAALERIDVTGSRIGRADEPAVLPPVNDDAKLPPAQWIERIRARVNAADGAGARESLRRLLARYPNAEIPADFAPLRK